ncbi:Hsp20/alpha crystallin family protein [Rhizobium giardinii]
MALAVELPGLEENDIEVLLEDGILTLRGEEKSEDRDGTGKYRAHRDQQQMILAQRKLPGCCRCACADLRPTLIGWGREPPA